MEKVALVTGAAGGLGRPLVEKLAAAGWRLIVVSRDGERLARAYGGKHLQIEADCSSVAGARQVMAIASEHDLLQNRVGTLRR